MNNTNRLVKMSLLSVLSLSLFVIETKIPNLIPIPGIKLGLANIVTVWAIYKFKPSETAMIVLVRIVLGSIFCGTALSLIYSICGASACFIVSMALKKIIPAEKIWLTSIIGAISHNFGQIVAAALILKTPAIFVYIPALLLSGVVSGLFCGLCAMFTEKTLHKLQY